MLRMIDLISSSLDSYFSMIYFKVIASLSYFNYFLFSLFKEGHLKLFTYFITFYQRMNFLLALLSLILRFWGFPL